MFENVFTLTGRFNRINRLAYFSGMCFVFLVVLFSNIIYSVVVTRLGATIGGLVGFCLFGLTMWMYTCLFRKRLHDLDKSAWFILVMFVPIINFIFGLYLLFAKGVEGDNKYGPDPLAQA